MMSGAAGRRRFARAVWATGLAILFIAGQGCSVKTMAVKTVANALSETGDVFTRDDDPVLVGDALPFALKLYESLLESVPTHVPLLVSTCSGFTQYGSAFVEAQAAQLDSSKSRATARAGSMLAITGRGGFLPAYIFRRARYSSSSLILRCRPSMSASSASTNSRNASVMSTPLMGIKFENGVVLPLAMYQPVTNAPVRNPGMNSRPAIPPKNFNG